MKITRKQNLVAVALICALANVFTTAQADETVTNSAATTMTTPEAAPVKAPDEAPWQFGVTAPLWAVGINGNATVRGHQQDVNLDFGQLKDHLDATFSIALEARKGKFDLYGDVGYMKFSADTFAPGPGKANAWAGLKFVLADAGVGYLLVQAGDEHPFVLEGTVGVRYWYADTSITLTGPAGNVLFSGNNIMDVVDPVIGLRGSQYLTRKLHLDFSADGGGFDLNHDTDWTWSASGVLTYDFVKWFSLSAGYKAVALDESEGSGTGKNGKNGVNLIFNGALVAATLKF